MSLLFRSIWDRITSIDDVDTDSDELNALRDIWDPVPSLLFQSCFTYDTNRKQYVASIPPRSKYITLINSYLDRSHCDIIWNMVVQQASLTLTECVAIARRDRYVMQIIRGSAEGCIFVGGTDVPVQRLMGRMD